MHLFCYHIAKSLFTRTAASKYQQPFAFYVSFAYRCICDYKANCTPQFHLDSATIFKPASKTELIAAIEDCLKLSIDCTKGPNGPIGDWDVTAVTDMSQVFDGDEGKDSYVAGAERFHGDISKWDVSRVTNMFSMFRHAKAFNGDISKWDVSRVTSMNSMFSNTIAFNADISNWNVARVTSMNNMFSNTMAFNADISKWNVARAANMGGMFYAAFKFDGDISKWEVSRVTDMGYMFNSAAAFSQTLCGAWAVSEADKTEIFGYTRGKMCSSL